MTGMLFTLLPQNCISNSYVHFLASRQFETFTTLLRAHMHRLGLSHTPNCPCETGPQTPEHILQTCPLHQEARTDHWPQGATLQEQLWGTKDSLILTTSFIQATKLEV
ncbi:hypothetical protein V1264_007222 [Littorina saxatilis]|uniref:Uncharacterized protein n=1 Tax=Littorina saxatilis TaxID=31220 RepID=A0AAN9AUR7_9CAEN